MDEREIKGLSLMGFSQGRKRFWNAGREGGRGGNLKLVEEVEEEQGCG